MPETWRTWRLGDATGVLLLAPSMLAWRGEPPVAFGRRAPWEAALLALTLAAVAFPVLGASVRVEYAILPCLVWAAFRFGRRGATTLTVLVVAALGRAMGPGP